MSSTSTTTHRATKIAENIRCTVVKLLGIRATPRFRPWFRKNCCPPLEGWCQPPPTPLLPNHSNTGLGAVHVDLKLRTKLELNPKSHIATVRTPALAKNLQVRSLLKNVHFYICSTRPKNAALAGASFVLIPTRAKHIEDEDPCCDVTRFKHCILHAQAYITCHKPSLSCQRLIMNSTRVQHGARLKAHPPSPLLRITRLLGIDAGHDINPTCSEMDLLPSSSAGEGLIASSRAALHLLPLLPQVPRSTADARDWCSHPSLGRSM